MSYKENRAIQKFKDFLWKKEISEKQEQDNMLKYNEPLSIESNENKDKTLFTTSKQDINTTTTLPDIAHTANEFVDSEQ